MPACRGVAALSLAAGPSAPLPLSPHLGHAHVLRHQPVDVHTSVVVGGPGAGRLVVHADGAVKGLELQPGLLLGQLQGARGGRWTVG